MMTEKPSVKNTWGGHREGAGRKPNPPIPGALPWTINVTKEEKIEIYKLLTRMRRRLNPNYPYR